MFEIGDIVRITGGDLHSYVRVEAFYQILDTNDEYGYMLVTDGENEPFWYHSDCFELVMI